MLLELRMYRDFSFEKRRKGKERRLAQLTFRTKSFVPNLPSSAMFTVIHDGFNIWMAVIAYGFIGRVSL